MMKAKIITIIMCAAVSITHAQTKHNGHEYIDLGLPSGVLWATCNVGANTPEEYGNYYAFGEIQTKNDYSWYTYKHGMYDSNRAYDTSNLTKYTVHDNKTTLDLSDDAAHMNWGGHWRMPTREEQEELLNTCTWQWSNVNGVNGYQIIGPNGKSIFLPAAGYCVGERLFTGTNNDYWSSTRGESFVYNAYNLSLSVNSKKMVCNYRYCGQSVRPIYDKTIKPIIPIKNNPKKVKTQKKPNLTK